MILLVIISSWLLVISLVVGLCAAARAGDAQAHARALAHAPSAPGGRRAASPTCEPATPVRAAMPTLGPMPVRVEARVSARAVGEVEDAAPVATGKGVAA
ncbi:MAG TPA: hypothetical protein VMF09_11120 [Solirubrobacteraceae bacterium]|nr:hypothetical protein [Solirubrobacteraceae bacterium]